MNSSACLLLRPPRFLAEFLCLAIVCAVPALSAQSTAQPLGVSPAQPFDATVLHAPGEIGAYGLVQVGDGPAWARPDFDDSQWLPVDAGKRLIDYFPAGQSPVVWHRIHVKVLPGQPGLALLASGVSRAFEVYVNGRELIDSGQVEPYIPYTRNARLIARIPQAQLLTGSLVIAIRARAPRTSWSSNNPAFNRPMLSLGDEAALRNQSMLSTIGENASTYLENLLAMGVGLVALALFISQRQRMEYFWIFVLGAFNAAYLPLLTLSLMRNISVNWWSLDELFQSGIYLAILLMVQAFLRKPFGWLLWLCSIVAILIATVCDLVYLYGFLPVAYDGFFVIPIAFVFALVIPILLFRQMRRGDREAGILLIPFLLSSVYLYAYVGLGMLQLIPALNSAAFHLWRRINAIPLGIVSIGLQDLGSLSFFFSLTIIMVLRSTRMSRQQALFEGELAAAREVQQVILPEHVESVPGFTVESVYQPAQQVGGDFFQVLPDGGGGLLLVVGDVAGKGLPAAMLVSVLVGAIRMVAEYTRDPAVVLSGLNQRLVGRTRGGFSTALSAHIDSNGLVTIANSGHLSPYLDGREVELPGALPLGIESGYAYQSSQFDLNPGSRLTFYSDGVIEAQNQSGELFGFDRAMAVSTQSAADIVQAAVQFGQSDDITVVAIQRAAAIATAA